MPITRKSQPSGFSRWRRVTTIPTAAQGRPITAAITPLSSWCDSRLSGTAAAKDSTASVPSALAQALGEPRRNRAVSFTAAVRCATGSDPLCLAHEPNPTRGPFRERYRSARNPQSRPQITD